VLRRNFHNFVYRENNPDEALSSPDLSGLPEEYEDFAAYDYWHYAVDCIARRELIVVLA
jgi:hypothetical protein